MSDVWHRITGVCRDGRFVPADKSRLDAIMREMDGKRFEMAIRKERKNRTLPQNAKLHVLAHLIAEQTGETYIHEKRRATLEALGLERGTFELEILGQKFLEVKHTSDMSTEELSLVIDRLLDNCKFLDMALPRDEDVEVMA